MPPTRTVLAALGLIVAAGLWGCTSEDDRPASFSYIYPTIIEPNCSTIGCHSSFVATYGLQLDTYEGAYAILVGAPCEPGAPPVAPQQNFVRPGQPDRSKLIYLLEGTDVPRRMPPDVPLPSKDVDLVRQWILEGAQCN